MKETRRSVPDLGEKRGETFIERTRAAAGMKYEREERIQFIEES